MRILQPLLSGETMMTTVFTSIVPMKAIQMLFFPSKQRTGHRLGTRQQDKSSSVTKFFRGLWDWTKEFAWTALPLTYVYVTRAT